MERVICFGERAIACSSERANKPNLEKAKARLATAWEVSWVIWAVNVYGPAKACGNGPEAQWSRSASGPTPGSLNHAATILGTGVMLFPAGMPFSASFPLCVGPSQPEQSPSSRVLDDCSRGRERRIGISGHLLPCGSAVRRRKSGASVPAFVGFGQTWVCLSGRGQGAASNAPAGTRVTTEQSEKGLHVAPVSKAVSQASLLVDEEANPNSIRPTEGVGDGNAAAAQEQAFARMAADHGEVPCSVRFHGCHAGPTARTRSIPSTRSCVAAAPPCYRHALCCHLWLRCWRACDGWW